MFETHIKEEIKASEVVIVHIESVHNCSKIQALSKFDGKKNKPFDDYSQC